MSLQQPTKRRSSARGFVIAATILQGLCLVSAQAEGLSGQVKDEQGGAIVGAAITVTDSNRTERSLSSDMEGKYAVGGLEPGTYAIRISAPRFTSYENNALKVSGPSTVINVTLRIAFKRDEITVLSGNPLVRLGEFGGSNIILRGEALDALPDGPGGLEIMLRALALRSAGPFGPPILVNGFEDSPIPPKQSIREIRINDNPFSAEYPQLGLGRVEILTKPGTDKPHGDLFFVFGDANLNSRNPFASNRAPFQSRLFGGDLSGPIVTNRANLFVDFNRGQDRSNSVINATILDSAFRAIPFQQAVVTPDVRRSFGPRMDIQLNSKNTLVARYGDSRGNQPASGIGGFSLLSRTENATTAVQTLQLTETAVFSPRSIMETKFQYVRNRAWLSGNNSTPVINVPGAFIGGGSDIGTSYNYANRTELDNFTSWQEGRHLLKAGVQIKSIGRTNGSTQNFGGTYTFNGRVAPQLNALDQIVLNGGVPVAIPITGLEAYRRTVLFQSKAFSGQQIRNLGGGASQLSLSAGQIEASLRQFEVGTFIQDDWRLTERFALNMGLRWEYQNDLGDRFDLAPRIGFAWGLGGGKGPSKTVVRGGAGMFYDRVADSLILRAEQLNGVNQRQFFTSDTRLLDLFPVVPNANVFSAVPQSTVQLASNLRTPYTTHASIAVERQIGRGVSIAATYSRINAIHILRSRDINPPTPSGRPYPAAGDIFAYESGGVFRQQQLLTNLSYRSSKNLSLWMTYTLSDSKSDTDGPDTFPANSFDLRSEYGRSALDARHTAYWGGWITLKGGIDLTPLVLWRSGIPFNITTGSDNNGDSLFTDRPAFATDLSRPSVIMTSLGTFDLNPMPGQQIIPRNLGQAPGFFIANLRVGKRFRIRERYTVQLSVQGTNLFNHTNPGLPVGILSSPVFGTATSAAGDWGLGSNQAGNRRLEFGLYFAF